MRVVTDNRTWDRAGARDARPYQWASLGGAEGTPRAEGGAGTLRANPTDALLRVRPYRLPVSQLSR